MGSSFGSGTGSEWYGTDARIRGPITDLSDLSHMPNLKVMYIVSEQITDLSPMKDLGELQQINLSNNNISDLSPLAGKDKLCDFSLLDNGMLEGIEVIRTWPAIRSLNFDNTGSYDGGPISEFQRYEYLGIKNNSDALKGDVAEFWHSDTFNIDAIIKDSKSRTNVDRSHDFASADVTSNFSKDFGLKYYRIGAESAKQQAKSVFERFKEYQSQGGKDSLEEKFF